MPRHLKSVLLALVLPLAVGCSSDDTPNPAGSNPNRTIKADPSFTNDIQEIIARKGCAAANCHGTAKSANLDLRPDSAYAQLVGVKAFQSDSLRVKPGDPQNSYLVIKVEGRQTTGSRMPLIGTNLDSIDIANLRNWIANGALDN